MEPFSTTEPFVDPQTAAEFLSIRPRRLLELARTHILPGHPLGIGKRKVWRFRLSELAAALTNRVDCLAAVPGRARSRAQENAWQKKGVCRNQ